MISLPIARVPRRPNGIDAGTKRPAVNTPATIRGAEKSLAADEDTAPSLFNRWGTRLAALLQGNSHAGPQCPGRKPRNPPSADDAKRRGVRPATPFAAL